MSRDNGSSACPADGDDAGAGSGAHALAGYDYQVDVSVWLALDLLLASKLASVIELEPATDEDIEADLTAAEPGRVATQVDAGGYRLVVQAKLRGGDAWTVSGINALLRHGGKKRVSAARRLADPGVRYLLVTSAGLNGLTKGLAVGRIGAWPKAGRMPVSTVGALPSGAAGRVGIIGNLDEDRLVGEVKRLLVDRFGVPNSRWVECLHKLREEGRLRVRRVGSGLWHREELAHVIRAHEGYLAASPHLEHYVHPQNWSSLREGMDAPRYAAVIIGQSGTGKTLATSKLYEELRSEMNGLTRVPIRKGPHQLRDDRTPPPVLYDIEDPWGRYDFDRSSRPWNDQLAGFLADATHDRRIVVTTRRDVAHVSGALGTVEPWLVPLEVEHYGPLERRRLYRTRIETLARDLQILAREAEPQVLDALASPLEIEKYFDALRISGRPDPRDRRGFVQAAIDRAHEGSIELTVVQQIQERDEVAAAAVLWALLKANDRLSLRALRDLESDLAERHARLGNGVTPLVNFLAAARNLRVGEGEATYYHPRVESGVLTALKLGAVPAASALRALVDVLTDPEGLDPAWGAGVAARILEAVSKVPELKFAPRSAARAAIDAWIDGQFSESSTEVPGHLQLAAVVGSQASTGGEFGRYIRHRRDKSFARMLHWASPGHPESWYERMRSDPTTRTIAARFVREVLPEDRTSYGKAFVSDLDRIAPNLTPVFLEATAGVVSRGYDPAVDTLAAGALRDLDGFEPILDAAVEELAPSDGTGELGDDFHLNYLNGVYSDEHAEYMSERDDGHTAQSLIQAYVSEVRAVRGWRNIATHRHAERLLSDWMRSLMVSAKEEGAPTSDELEGAFAAAQGGEDEHALWYVLRLHWDPAFSDRLRERVVQGADHEPTRTAALACVIAHRPDMLPHLMEELQSSGADERAIEIAIDLGSLLGATVGDPDPSDTAAIAARSMLSPEHAAIAQASVGLRAGGELEVLAPAGAAALAGLQATRRQVRRLRIRHHATLGRLVAFDIAATLAEARVDWEDNRACGEAIEAAIALGLTTLVEEGLGHMFSDVVAPALTAVGEPLPAPLPQTLLALVDAKGSPVRKALVGLLAGKPHAGHVSTLMTLAHDRWSLSYRSHDEDENFPIARMAVAALVQCPGLAEPDLERLDALAIATDDPHLRNAVFGLIASRGGGILQARLYERACSPGRIAVRRAAANALIFEASYVDPAVVGSISGDMLKTRAASIAVPLALLVALRATEEDLLVLARSLAASPKRRVLVLAMLWATIQERSDVSGAIEDLLPASDPAVAWVRSGATTTAADDAVSDLGDPVTCAEVLRWLNPAGEAG